MFVGRSQTGITSHYLCVFLFLILEVLVIEFIIEFFLRGEV